MCHLPDESQYPTTWAGFTTYITKAQEKLAVTNEHNININKVNGAKP